MKKFTTTNIEARECVSTAPFIRFNYILIQQCKSI